MRVGPSVRPRPLSYLAHHSPPQRGAAGRVASAAAAGRSTDQPSNLWRQGAVLRGSCGGSGSGPTNVSNSVVVFFHFSPRYVSRRDRSFLFSANLNLVSGDAVHVQKMYDGLGSSFIHLCHPRPFPFMDVPPRPRALKVNLTERGYEACTVPPWVLLSRPRTSGGPSFKSKVPPRRPRPPPRRYHDSSFKSTPNVTTWKEGEVETENIGVVSRRRRRCRRCNVDMVCHVRSTSTRE